MDIALHIGANCTDGDMLVRSLTKNAADFADQGTAIPPLTKYRRLLRETIQNLGGSAPLPETHDILIRSISDVPDPKRLVMTNSAFICLPIRVFEAGEFYGLATMKMRALNLLFPDDQLHLFLALRNPATFIPAAHASTRNRSFEAFLSGMDPRSVKWSSLVARIQAAAPTAQLTVWCNEDTPLIWGDIMRRMIGVPPDTRLAGEFDVLSKIMSSEGMARFASYLKSHPPKGEAQLRRVISAFLDKYAMTEEIEEEIDVPEWDDRMVEELTVLYEADVEDIAAMDGVEFLRP